MVMDSYSLTDISITAVAVIGALTSCIVVLEKSRCTTINICCGALRCKRKVPTSQEVEPIATDNNV